MSEFIQYKIRQDLSGLLINFAQNNPCIEYTDKVQVAVLYAHNYCRAVLPTLFTTNIPNLV